MKCLAEACNMRERGIKQSAWDGKWYRRAYYDDGAPIGSIECDECKIDIDRCSFLKLYLQRFNEIYAAYSEHGFGIVREQWLQNTDHFGGEIKVNMENTAEDGIFRGLDNNGALLLEQQGKIRKIYAGDVFIKRK